MHDFVYVAVCVSVVVFVVNTVAPGQVLCELHLLVFPPVSYSTGAA